MNFIRLHDKVRNNQIIARTDHSFARLSHKEKAKVHQIRMSQEDARNYQ